VIAKVEGFSVDIGGQETKVNLNILPVGSYDVFIGMDWLEGRWSLVNCRDKIINFLIDEGNIQ